MTVENGNDRREKGNGRWGSGITERFEEIIFRQFKYYLCLIYYGIKVCKIMFKEYVFELTKNSAILLVKENNFVVH